MGWNDRNPELYEAITGNSYATGLPLDGPASQHAPEGWLPPAMRETCPRCKTVGDVVQGFTMQCCKTCDIECCTECAGDTDHDEDGTILWCPACYIAKEGTRNMNRIEHPDIAAGPPEPNAIDYLNNASSELKAATERCELAGLMLDEVPDSEPLMLQLARTMDAIEELRSNIDFTVESKTRKP